MQSLHLIDEQLHRELGRFLGRSDPILDASASLQDGRLIGA